LRGDMSLVGPRPPLPSEVARYDVRAFRRLTVKPGVTCLWQISGRSDLSFDDWVDLDNRYINSRSPSLDLRILIATVPAVLKARGAY
jgi:lipopolysaccharide/colanic/teichoic acid biosynthesis glycosyltransferase